MQIATADQTQKEEIEKSHLDDSVLESLSELLRRNDDVSQENNDCSALDKSELALNERCDIGGEEEESKVRGHLSRF